MTDSAVMGKHERIAGIRFHQLIHQLIDDGWKVREIANAVGIDETHVTKWKNAKPTDAHTVGRKGITDAVIGGVREAFGLSSEYFFMANKSYSGQVVNKRTGETRKAKPLEIDYKEAPAAGVIDIASAREKRLVAQVAEQDSQIKQLTAAQEQMSKQLAMLTAAIENLLHKPAAGGGGGGGG